MRVSAVVEIKRGIIGRHFYRAPTSVTYIFIGVEQV